VRGVLTRVEHLVPDDVGGRDTGRKIRCRRRGQRGHTAHGDAALRPGMVTRGIGGRGGSSQTAGGIGYHFPIIYRAIEKYKPEPEEASRAPRRRPGRPRAIPAPVGTDAREAILDAAARLFAANGYAATGTREIATEVGLRQASLFHYFSRKEDILAELLDRTVSPSLDATAWLAGRSEPAQIRLYLVVRQDVINLFGSRHTLAALQLLPEARSERFADFWAKRARLRRRYQALVREMSRAGLVIDAPIELMTDVVFGAVEATMTWSERSRRSSPVQIANTIAAAAVRGIMVKPPEPRTLQAGADRLVRNASAGSAAPPSSA
jgi:AcrR family transcriptional regulator